MKFLSISISRNKQIAFFEKYHGVFLSFLMASYFLMITKDINYIGRISFILLTIIIGYSTYIHHKESKINKDIKSYSHNFFVNFGYTILISDIFTYLSFNDITNISMDKTLWAYGTIFLLSLVCIFSGFLINNLKKSGHLK